MTSELVTASRVKLKVAKVLASHRAGRVLGAVTGNRVWHRGLWFDVHSKDFSPSVRAQMFWGIYEGAETRMIKSLLRGSRTVVELGSSLGVTTAHVAAGMAPSGHLVCVEANPQLIPGLQRRLNRWTSSLELDVIHAAVSAHCGSTGLTIAPQTVSSRLGSSGADADNVLVPARTLRQILEDTGVSEFDLVSDIEGAEATFLMKDPEALNGCRRVVMELHDTTVDGEALSVFDLIDALDTAGFKVVQRHGPVVAAAR